MLVRVGVGLTSVAVTLASALAVQRIRQTSEMRELRRVPWGSERMTGAPIAVREPGFDGVYAGALGAIGALTLESLITRRGVVSPLVTLAVMSGSVALGLGLRLGYIRSDDARRDELHRRMKEVPRLDDYRHDDRSTVA